MDDPKRQFYILGAITLLGALGVVTTRNVVYGALFLLVAGAMSVIRHGRKTNFEKNPWLADLVRRTPAKVAAVALANKNARTAWALLVRGETYKAAPAA